MSRIYPCLEVDLNKIRHNTKYIVEKCKEKDIDVYGVTKVFCAYEPVVKAMIESGVSGLADSRVQNLKKLEGFDIDKVLLRIPTSSQAEEVVKYCDVSLNSEYFTIKKLSEAAVKLEKTHRIILMMDLGDLREGFWEDEVIDVAREIVKLPNIEIEGVGTNLTCYGGVIPDDKNLGKLVEIKNKIEKELGISLKVVSGGNSSSLYKVLDNTIPEGVTNLRIGEAIVLGRETAYGNRVESCYEDAFIVKSEIIELREKPSVPMGNIGMNAFGQKPTFEDKGRMKRAIVSIGRQDITLEGLFPVDSKVNIVGASSDHLIIDVTNSDQEYKVGDVVSFTVDYGCLMQAATSQYVEKYFVE